MSLCPPSPCLTVLGARVTLGDDSRLSASRELSHLLPGHPASWEGSEVPGDVGLIFSLQSCPKLPSIDAGTLGCF